jgi:hypothetical protein
VLEKLAEIRMAIAGEVAERDGVGGRAALLRLFDAFVLHAGLPAEAHVELIGETWIDSRQAVTGYDEDLRPVLARKPLMKGQYYAGTFQP